MPFTGPLLSDSCRFAHVRNPVQGERSSSRSDARRPGRGFVVCDDPQCGGSVPPASAGNLLHLFTVGRSAAGDGLAGWLGEAAVDRLFHLELLGAKTLLTARRVSASLKAARLRLVAAFFATVQRGRVLAFLGAFVRRLGPLAR